YVRQLLVRVGVARHDRALLEIDVREHDALARDEPTFERLRDALLRHRLPAVQRDTLRLHSLLLMNRPAAALKSCLVAQAWGSDEAARSKKTSSSASRSKL